MAGPEQYSGSVEERTRPSARVRSLSLPLDLIRQAELSGQAGRSPKIEVLREALRRYGQENRWRWLKRYGAGRARKAGLTAANVERAVREYRRCR